MGMNHSDGRVGQRVMFGRKHGEQTMGVIVKVNPKKFKVKQLESRGGFRDYPVGTVWTVPAILCGLVDPAGVVMPPIAYADTAQPRRRRLMSRDDMATLERLERQFAALGALVKSSKGSE
jgi:hypothetical protein